MHRRLAQWIAALGFAGLGVTSSACVIRETGVNRGYGYGYAQAGYNGGAGVYVGDPNPYYVSSLPPEPLYETMSSSPGYGYVWIDGYWNWNGYEWVWVNGRWTRDQAGYVYVQPYYDYDVGGRYVYYPGHWSRPERVPERVKIIDHRDGRPRTGYQPPRSSTPPGTRDHRGGGQTPPHDSTPPSRDHRDDAPPPRDTTPPPRDHRGDGDSPTPPPRDHRDEPRTPPDRKTPDRAPTHDRDPGTPTRPKAPRKTPKPDRAPTHDRAPADTPKAPKTPRKPPEGGSKQHAPDRQTPRTPPKRDHRRSSMLPAGEPAMKTGHAVAMVEAREPAMLPARPRRR